MNDTLKIALEAADGLKDVIRRVNELIAENKALKAALAQPAQEPLCPCCKAEVLYECVACSKNNYPDQGHFDNQPFYTTPPQRTWELIETAPKDGTDVLVMYVHIDTQVVHNGFWIGTDDTDNESEIGWWSYQHSEVSRIKLDDWMTPTHWLPLPELKEKNT
jgi:hypothetical protein